MVKFHINMADFVNEREMSEFNMAISYLNRLNNLFYECDRAAITVDGFTWFNVLVTLFRELSTEMTAQEITEWNKKVLSMNNKVQLYQKNLMRTGEAKMTNELYFELHGFEMFLRKITKSAGLQLKMREDPAKALR